jgi:hypothetical protein
MAVEVFFPGTGMHADFPEHHPNPCMNPRLAMVTLRCYTNWVMYYDDPQKADVRLVDGRLTYGLHIFVGYKNGERVAVHKPITVLPLSYRVELLSDKEVAKALTPFFEQRELFKSLPNNSWTVRQELLSQYDELRVESIDPSERQQRTMEALDHGVSLEEVNRTEFYYAIPSARADEIQHMVQENLFPVQSTLKH